MRRKTTWLLAIGAVLFLAPFGVAEPRTWTDATGRFSVQAELVDFRDGQVRLRTADGRVVSLDVRQLSDGDRQFLRDRSGAAPGPGETRIAVGNEVEIEMLSGARARGVLLARDENVIAIRAVMGGRTFERKYPRSRIHALVAGGKREVLNEQTGASPGGSGAGANPARPNPSAEAPAAGARRSRAEVEALIDRLGRTPPDWFDSVPLNYPNTLDLDWPHPAPKEWNNQRNVGQYVWDVINPNPGKWREGVRLMHHLLSLHQDKPSTRTRAMNSLGQMYYALLQDYARAAFWWRQAGVDRGQQFLGSSVHLAECYWKLGNRQMALELLGKLPPQFTMIKLLGDMGELDRALRLAEANARGPYADVAYVYAGEACRVAGKYRQALEYYGKLAALPANGRDKKRIERNQALGRDAAEALRLFELLDLKRVPDGSYRAASPAYAGDLHVEVGVAGGRIESVRVVQHQEKQFYAALTETPQKLIEKQSVKGVDATSGATITSKAIINATAKALAGAMK